MTGRNGVGGPKSDPTAKKGALGAFTRKLKRDLDEVFDEVQNSNLNLGSNIANYHKYAVKWLKY